MKFLVPNNSCLQNLWLRGYRPQIPVLSVLCPQLNLITPPTRKKFLGTPLCAGALSWCRIQSPSRHFSGRFRRTDSNKLRTVIRYLSYCQSPDIANDCSKFSNHLLVSRPERGSLSTEILPSFNRRNQSNTCVRPIASSPYACCNNWYVSVVGFPI